MAASMKPGRQFPPSAASHVRNPLRNGMEGGRFAIPVWRLKGSVSIDRRSIVFLSIPIPKWRTSLIPQEKSAAVTRGLNEAFGVTEFEDIRKMTKGHTSALVFRIVVQGRPYLLRIIMRTNSILGPTRQFTCMKAAAEAGLAPHVWYTSTEDQISI